MRRTYLRIAGVSVAAVALVGAFDSPAFAGSNSAHAYGISASGCAHVSDGWFEADGDWFNIKDTCSDGFSAALKVDVQPYAPDGGYDYIIWNSVGAGSIESESHNVTEGMGVCISAGLGHPGGEIGGFGDWECGIA